MTEFQVVDLGNFPVDEATPVVAGPRGQDGADGADGASAYEVAVANGFVGTEAEWLASLAAEGGGGAVDSVNGDVGVVVLDAADVGAETPTGAQAKVDAHAADTTGVHGIADTAALATTADVSTASTADRARANHTGTQSADTLTDGTTNKAFLATERTKLAGVATGATANDTDANLKNRANHTGTQAASTITGLGDAAAKNTGTTAGTVAAGDDSRITGAAQKSANLSDLANAGTARTNLGLGTAATKNVPASGNAASTEVVMGNDTRLSGGGGGSHAAAAYNNAGTSIPNDTETFIPLTSEDFDTDAFHDPAVNNTRLTIPTGQAGYYLITATVAISYQSSNQRSTVVYINGSRVNSEDLPAQYASTVTSLYFAFLNVGDYVQMAFYQNSGGALTLKVNDVKTRLAMFRLGA